MIEEVIVMISISFWLEPLVQHSKSTIKKLKLKFEAASTGGIVIKTLDTHFFIRGMVINSMGTNYSIKGMVIKTQNTNYSTRGMVFNTQDTN